MEERLNVVPIIRIMRVVKILGRKYVYSWEKELYGIKGGLTIATTLHVARIVHVVEVKHVVQLVTVIR